MYGRVRCADLKDSTSRLLRERCLQLDRIQDIDIRQPSVHRQDLTWVTDYLIGSHTSLHPIGGSDNDLGIFVGSNE